jgi:hypothetical protein
MKKFFAVFVLVMFAFAGVAFAEGTGGVHGEKASETTFDKTKITKAPKDPITGTVQAATDIVTAPVKAVTTTEKKDKKAAK